MRSPESKYWAHGVGNARCALKLEAAAIDLLGIENLANAIKGHGSKYGRMPLHEVVAYYTKRKADIREPSILIRINKLYRYGMTDADTLRRHTKCVACRSSAR